MQKKYPKFFSTLKVALITVFIGAVGIITGILGGIISPQIFLPEDIIQLRPIVFEDKTASRTNEKEIDISDIARTVAPSIGELYRVSQKNNSGSFDVHAFPLAKDFLGYALIGTADGWILLPPSISPVHMGDIRFIDNEKRSFQIEKRISDPATGLQYAKLTLPRNSALKPIQFDTTTDIGASRSVYQITSARIGIPLSLTPLEYPLQKTLSDAIQSPSVFKKRFNASEEFLNEGMPLVTEKKEVIGLTTHEGILPMAYIQDSFTEVLRSKNIQHAVIALQYIDLSLSPIGFSTSGRGLIKNGAYVVSSQKRPFPLPGPKGNVFFEQGDIITNINNEILDTSHNFSEIVQQYKKGDVITLEYFHLGEKKIAQVTLQ